MQELIDKEQPTAIVIYLGINDVWHGPKGTTKPDFEAGLQEKTDCDGEEGRRRRPALHAHGDRRGDGQGKNKFGA